MPSVEREGRGSKYIVSAGMLWPLSQCGQETETFRFFIRAKACRSVSMAVTTSREVCGQRYLSALIFFIPFHADRSWQRPGRFAAVTSREADTHGPDAGGTVAGLDGAARKIGWDG